MQLGLFDTENRLKKLSKLGDSLVRLNKVIDWEQFRPVLATVLKKEPKGAGGRPPYDCILMFKILILQRRQKLVWHRNSLMVLLRSWKQSISSPAQALL